MFPFESFKPETPPEIMLKRIKEGIHTRRVTARRVGLLLAAAAVIVAVCAVLVLPHGVKNTRQPSLLVKNVKIGDRNADYTLLKLDDGTSVIVFLNETKTKEDKS